MTMPVVGTWAQRLYDRLGEITAPDAANDYALLRLIGMLGDVTHQDIEDLVVDQDDGTPGWGILLDPGRCPTYALPWLGQLVGVTVDTTKNDATQRAQILAVGGWFRGSYASLVGAATPYLTGTKYVQLIERYNGDAYQILYITHTAETPADPTAMQAAVMAQKPAGIILTFANNVGQTWQDVKNNQATWQAVKNNYATWNDVRNG